MHCPWEKQEAKDGRRAGIEVSKRLVLRYQNIDRENARRIEEGDLRALAAQNCSEKTRPRSDYPISREIEDVSYEVNTPQEVQQFAKWRPKRRLRYDVTRECGQSRWWRGDKAPPTQSDCLTLETGHISWLMPIIKHWAPQPRPYLLKVAGYFASDKYIKL